MKFRSPYQCAPKPEIVRVGNPQTGFIYLLSKHGDPSPCEKPTDRQARDRRQALITPLVFQAVKAYSEKHQVPEQVAKEIMLSAKPNLVYTDYLSEDSRKLHSELMEEAIQNYASKENVPKKQARALVYQAMTPVINQTDVSLFDYLTPEQTTQYLELVSESSEVAYKAATLMIKYRLAYAVILSKDVDPKSKTLYIHPAPFPMMKGDRLRFSGYDFTLAESVAYDDTEISIVEGTPIRLSKDDPGFLVNPKTNKEVIGDPEWTEQKTYEDLGEAQIEGLYSFYKAESGELQADDLEAEEEGNSTASSRRSTTTQPAPLLTGNESSGDSNTSEPAMSA